MAYTKQTWADLPSKTTPINAERLTHIEDGIFNAAQTADTAASTAGTAAANIGIVSGRVETLTGRVNGLDTAVSNKVDKVTGKGLSTNDYDGTDKGKVDSLGTASTKNSTSVVTESSDLVESGAVKDIVGWGNKNLLPLSLDTIKKINNHGAWSNNTFTYNDIAFTVLTDSNGSITGISANGTATGRAYIYLCDANYGNNSFNFDDNTVDGFTYSGTITFYKRFIYYNSEAKRVYILIDTGEVCDHVVFYPQREKGSTVTTYEPYHASVSDSLAEKCDNSVIGTVEDGSNPTKAYAVNEFMVRDGAFCQVTAPVTTSSTWTEGSNYTKKSIAEVLQSLMS